MCGDVESEEMVATISDGRYDVHSLGQQLIDWVTNGFPLDHDNSMRGKHHKPNYRSAVEDFKPQVTKSLLKRLATGKTVGPFSWDGDPESLPFTDCGINPLGAVPYKLEPGRARACDDPWINEAITPPHFKMTALDMLRDNAYPFCSWLKSDIDSAFPVMNVRHCDLPWMLFSWFHPEDTTFRGTDQDCLYVHPYANFGPRPWPFQFTMLMMWVNIAGKATGIDIPAAFIDDNIHTDDYDNLQQLAPAYYKHLNAAGMPDKVIKRELLRYWGEILGRWFDSVHMTISIPQDKVTRLSCMFADFRLDPKCSYTTLSELLGFWEFCATLLPKFMAAFSYTAYQFRNKLMHLPKGRKLWAPREVRRDLRTIEFLFPSLNTTVALQPRSGRRKAAPLFTDAKGGKN